MAECMSAKAMIECVLELPETEKAKACMLLALESVDSTE
jgi:hypothetical protein